MIFWVYRGIKGQKTVQNDKKFSLLHSISQDLYIICLSLWCKCVKMAQNDKHFCLLYLISYDLHLWYTCRYKRITSPGIFFFFFFSKFWFLRSLGVGVGGKRAKNGPKWQKILSASLHVSGTVHHVIGFWYTCVKWWYLQQIFSLFKFWFWGF